MFRLHTLLLQLFMSPNYCWEIGELKELLNNY